MWANMLRAFQVGKARTSDGCVELDAAVARDNGPRLAGVPFDEGFSIRRNEDVLIDAGIRLADLGVSSSIRSQ